jgi:hypothetical protein
MPQDKQADAHLLHEDTSAALTQLSKPPRSRAEGAQGRLAPSSSVRFALDKRKKRRSTIHQYSNSYSAAF